MCVYVCMSIWYMCADTSGSQKGVSGHLELDWQMNVRCSTWMLRNKLRTSKNAVFAFCAVSLIQTYNFLHTSKSPSRDEISYTLKIAIKNLCYVIKVVLEINWFLFISSINYPVILKFKIIVNKNYNYKAFYKIFAHLMNKHITFYIFTLPAKQTTIFRAFKW